MKIKLKKTLAGFLFSYIMLLNCRLDTGSAFWIIKEIQVLLIFLICLNKLYLKLRCNSDVQSVFWLSNESEVKQLFPDTFKKTGSLIIAFKPQKNMGFFSVCMLICIDRLANIFLMFI